MGKRLYILTVILCCVLVYGFYYAVIPHILNLNTLNPYITKYIEANYGFKVKIENPSLKMGYTPSVWVRADKFRIVNNDGSDALSVEKPIVEMSIFPLIIGKINLKYLSAKNIYADVSIDKNFRLAIGDYLIVKASNFVVNISGSKILIDNFLFNLKDKIKQQKVAIDGNYFYIEKYQKNRYLKSAADIAIKSGKNTSVLNYNIDTKLPFNSHLDDFPPEISASVTNLNLASLSNFINLFSKGNISDIGGLINVEFHSDKEILEQKQYISNLIIDNFYCESAFLEKRFVYPHKLHLKSLFLLSGDLLNIPSLKLWTSDLAISISGSIDDINSKKSVPNVNIKIDNQKASDLLELLPYCKTLNDLTKINVSVIKDADFSANVNVNLDIKDTFVDPNMYGDILLDNAYVSRPIKNAPKNAYIGIKFKGKNLDLNVNVPTNIKQEVNVTGTIDLYGEQNSDLHITSTELIDLSEAERILMPVHKAFNFLIGPVPIMGFGGYGSIDLKVKGTKKDPHTFGWFKTNGAMTFFDDIPDLILKNADSILTFNDFNTTFKLVNGTINGKKVSIDGTCNLVGKFNFDAKLPNQNSYDLVNILKKSQMLKTFAVSVNEIESIKGNSDLSLNINGQLLDINELNLGKNVHTKGTLSLNNVEIVLNQLKSKINNLKGSINFDDTNYNLNLSTGTAKQNISLTGNIRNDIASVYFKTDTLKISELLKIISIPQLSVAADLHDNSYAKFDGRYNGSISKFNINNLKINGQISFSNFICKYVPYKLPIKILSGQVNIKNNVLELMKLNTDIGTARTVIGGKIFNLSENPSFDLSVYSKLNQKFADYVYNYNAVYPVKIKGDVTLTSIISGKLSNPVLKANVKIGKDSSIYYMGAAIGEDDLPVNLSLNADFNKNRLYIKSFIYDKVIKNAQKIYPIRQLSASGFLYLNNINDIGFKNFRVVTSEPTTTKIFNIAFKKPLIKNGSFTSNLTLNGSVSRPNIYGNLDLHDVDLPFIDASIKNISLKFLPSNVYAKISGNILNNSFEFDANAVNKLYPPFIINDAKLNSGNLNIDNFINSINNSSIESGMNSNLAQHPSYDLSQIIIKKLQIAAENVSVYNINANKLKADISLNNGIFNVNNFRFNLANGLMDGSAGYNIGTQKSDFDLNVKNADADLLVNSLFGLKGQIYGDLDGHITLTCSGSNQAECLHNLSGNTVFQVRDGKMPKLGSLEYLLRAGNLLKSGLTGLSINGIIDIIVPLKTGNFDFIKGSINIKNGIADNIQILTNGKNLNLFITGEYNLSTFVADMYVFGRLSKKISTPFGPFGNASLNTLFNTIPGVNLSSTSDKSLINGINKLPGVELSNKLYRVFAAEIHGDITGEDYVESFRWVE